jgi:uncharacterized phage protein gp47/JayE
VASQQDISAQIISALGVSEPDLDTSVGSVTRKIIDAVASAISDVSSDTQLLTYQYDVNAQTGSALDAFVQLFGMSRFPAARATAVITFTRGTASDVVSVPIATQVATSDGTVVFQTLSAGILSSGALSVSVPAQAVQAGPQGNVAAASLTSLLNPVAEVTGVLNASAASGGTNQETDAQLRTRWKTTAFKSMAGTSSMFLGLALNNVNCTAANAIGASTRRTEQLQISGGQAISTVTDAQFIYPSGQVVGHDIDNGDVAVPGVQYTWNYAVNPPQVQVIDHTYFPEGQLIDLSFVYMDEASRNSNALGIYNRTDVYCAGTDATAAAQSVAFQPLIAFSSTPSSNYYAGSFIRPDSTIPAAGNIFIPLAFGPVLTVPAILIVGGIAYGLATPQNPIGTSSAGVSYAYQIVHRTGAFGWSPYSDFGLEWAANFQPVVNSVIVVGAGYTYNAVPRQIQQDVENWKLAGTDVLAHQGITQFLQFSLAIIYDTSVTISVTQQSVNTALANYLSTLGFNATLYASTVLNIVEGTPGVIAARFLTGDDYGGWNPASPNSSNVGIQQVVNGAVVNSYVNREGEPLSVFFGDDTFPSFGGTVLATKAVNTFGGFS